MLKAFHSRDNSINIIVSRRPDYINKKGESYDNRDVIYLYLFENPETNEQELIGYISCAASSMYSSFNGNRVVVPSVVINTFAIDDKYTEKSGYRISDGLAEYKCSYFIMRLFLKQMDDLSYTLGINQVYLFAQEKAKVVNFYKECAFAQIKADSKVFGGQESREYTYLCLLENGKTRV